MQKYMPEGYNTVLCKDFTELHTSFTYSKKICAKVLSLDPMKEEFMLQITKDNSISGYIKLDKISFREKSLVGQYVDCYFKSEPQIGVPCELMRDTKEAENFCLTNYTVGDKLIGKVVTFVPYGTMIDIGGGFCALLPNNDFLEGIEHGTALLKEGDFVNVVVKEIADGKIKVKI